MIETGKDVAAIRKGKEGGKQFLHGVDTLAAYGMALSCFLSYDRPNSTDD